MIDYKNSIVIIGAVGAGKGLVSKALARKLNMEVINCDEFRHLPSIKEIKRVLSSHDIPPRIHDEFLRYKHLREKYPNIKNYKDFGFKRDVSEYLKHNFGDTAWHFYQKAFENFLMQEICENVSGAVILDTGGGMPISFDEGYKTLQNKFISLDKKLFFKEFNHLDHIGKHITDAIFGNFENIIYLQMPEHKSQRSTKANENSFNKIALHSGDYDRLCTHKIHTDNLFSGNNHSDVRLNQIVCEIEDFCNSSSQNEI